MANSNDIQKAISDTAQLLTIMESDKELCNRVSEAVNLAIMALKSGNKLLFCGNGGSAADAQHWAGELVSRFYYDRPGLPAIALTTDTSILTAIGNDYGYESVFSRQIEALGQDGDVLLAISTSGNSANIVKALDTAKKQNLKTIGFTGQNTGKMVEYCDICIQIPSTSTPRIQEGHEVIGHTICALIESEIFSKN